MRRRFFSRSTRPSPPELLALLQPSCLSPRFRPTCPATRESSRSLATSQVAHQPGPLCQIANIKRQERRSTDLARRQRRAVPDQPHRADAELGALHCQVRRSKAQSEAIAATFGTRRVACGKVRNSSSKGHERLYNRRADHWRAD